MRHLIAILLLAGLLVGCGKADKAAPSAAAGSAGKATAPTLLLASEDLRTLASSPLASGPVVTGSVQPARRADLRAEVPAVVLQVLKDNGEAVRAGELLVRLDDTAIRDSLASAEETVRAAAQTLEQAERQVQRLKTLQQQGMTSTQALEDAELRRNNAQSDWVAAKSRVVAARQQMQRTSVRAPFDGLVSERKASVGDTVQVGKELLKVIDPRSMRFEGLVSADHMQALKVGQPVSFRINGFTQGDFAGTLQRIDSAANATTRQVAVLVAFAEPASAPRVAGLFAEGRIETGSSLALMVQEAALVRAGEAVFVWRAKDRTLAKVAVKLGERDARSGEYPVVEGLAAGDRILRKPGGSLVEGQKFEWAAAARAGSAAQ
ncbi:MAG: efflux RND transporter periplasmic adaptor subunit [Rubrivivax sp.]|nr:efflux RND transporter periplasmic adaptor subunit [Rubrivivax sp.]